MGGKVKDEGEDDDDARNGERRSSLSSSLLLSEGVKLLSPSLPSESPTIGGIGLQIFECFKRLRFSFSFLFSPGEMFSGRESRGWKRDEKEGRETTI